MTEARAKMILHDIAKYGVLVSEGRMTIQSSRWPVDTGFPQYGDPDGRTVRYVIWSHELQEAIRVGLGKQETPLWRYEQAPLPYM